MDLMQCYMPVFRCILQIITFTEATSEYDKTNQKVIALLEQSVHQANNSELTEDEKSAAQFAVIAWIDEMILCSQLPWREQWQNEPLQLRYFNTTTAGQDFFTLLTTLAPEYHQARWLFLVCLQLGFHGKFTVNEDDAALQELIAEQRTLCLPATWQDWPNNAEITPEARIFPAKRKAKKQAARYFAIGGIALYAVLYFILHQVIN